MSTRDQLISKVQSPVLQRIVNELYRPGAQVGDGGTADKIRQELIQLGVNNSPHLQKGIERMNKLTNELRKGTFSGADREIAIKLLRDLESAVPKDFWKHTLTNW